MSDLPFPYWEEPLMVLVDPVRQAVYSWAKHLQMWTLGDKQQAGVVMSYGRIKQLKRHRTLLLTWSLQKRTLTFHCDICGRGGHCISSWKHDPSRHVPWRDASGPSQPAVIEGKMNFQEHQIFRIMWQCLSVSWVMQAGNDQNRLISE